jgi:sugar phosphate permease
MGGMILLVFVPNGPYRKSGQTLQLNAFLAGFRNKDFKSSAIGYFGHMWELYAFWAFIPVMLLAHKSNNPLTAINIPFLSFMIIASGGLACACSGLLSKKFSPKSIATSSLFLSCLCCILSPFFLFSSTGIFISFLFFWGLVVVADSPLFSTLVAQNSPAASRGTSLTIVNCIGFAITILSIQFMNLISSSVNSKYMYVFLAIGPIIGLTALLTNRRTK